MQGLHTSVNVYTIVFAKDDLFRCSQCIPQGPPPSQLNNCKYGMMTGDSLSQTCAAM